jgi:gliding motility-associated-like protein
MVSGSAAVPLQYQIGTGTYVPTNPFTGLAAGNYTFTIKDANGCITPTINATVAAGPNLAATNVVTNVSCFGGNNGSITLTNTNGNAPYQYSINGGTLQPSSTFNNLTLGTYNIGLADANGCTGNVSVTVAQPTALNATLTTTAALCNGATNGIINIAATNGTPGYQYSNDNGVTYQPGSTFNVAAGTYSIKVKDANSCIVTLNATITEPTALNVTATTTNASCNGGADGTITAVGSGGTASYSYSIDGTNFVATNLFNVLPGNYTISVKDANGCIKTINKTVGLTSNIVVDTRTDTTICESKSVTLTTTSNATSFLWRPNASLNDSTLKSPIATPVVTTKYYVLASLGGCTAVDSVTVTVNPAPIADAGLDNTICYGKTDTLQGSGGIQFLWAPASSLSNATISNPVANATTTTKYWLHVVDANGCSSLIADTMQLIVTPPLQVYAGPDTTVVLGQPYQLSASLLGASGSVISPTSLQYLWMPSFGLNNATLQNPLATIFANQTYTVEISTPEGCKGVGVVRLEVLMGPEIYVPTGFTPNGDGLNDRFKVFPVGIKQFDYLRVYNRWGQLVFETKDPAIGWDAKLRGLDQPTGAFIFVVQGVTDKGKVINKKGTVVLTR